VHAHGSGGITAQVEAGMRRVGPAALDAAHHAVGRLHDAVGEVAVQRLDGNDEPMPALLARTEATSRPPSVPKALWDAFLSDVLARSGLVMRRGADFVFLHQTLMEYLAARHVGGDQEASKAAFWRFFDSVWTWNWPWSPFLYVIEHDMQELKPYDPPARVGRSRLNAFIVW